MAQEVAGDCLRWSGKTNEHGYGLKRVGEQFRLAHRLAYEAEHGPIPDGMVIDHLCRVRECVNTSHMEVVTPHINTLRGFSVPALNARKAACKRGHEFTPDNIAPKPSRTTGRGECRTCKRAQVRAYKLGISLDDYFALPADVRAMKPRAIAAQLAASPA